MKRATQSMSAPAFAAQVQALAANSDNVFLTVHAKVRMAERNITLPQILEVLRKGRVIENPALDIRGNWKATMGKIVDGHKIGVAVAISDSAIIITVF